MDRIRIRGGRPLAGRIAIGGAGQNGAAADDRLPSHRRDAGAAQPAAPRRHHHAVASPGPAWRLDHAPGRRARGRSRPRAAPQRRPRSAPPPWPTILVRTMRASVLVLGPWRAPGWRGCQRRAAALSARARLTCTSPGWSGWAPRSNCVRLARGARRMAFRRCRDRLPHRLGRRHREYHDGGELIGIDSAGQRRCAARDRLDSAASSRCGADIAGATATASASAASPSCTALEHERPSSTWIETGTYMMAAAITGGEAELVGARHDPGFGGGRARRRRSRGQSHARRASRCAAAATASPASTS